MLCLHPNNSQVYNAWSQCVGKKAKVKGESDEYTLEVIKYRKDNKGAHLHRWFQKGLLFFVASFYLCCSAF